MLSFFVWIMFDINLEDEIPWSIVLVYPSCSCGQLQEMDFSAYMLTA